MRLVLAIVTLAIVLTFVGGVGFVACRVFDLHLGVLVFGYTLWAAIATTFASLAVALVVGFYHLYLYLFTNRKPLSLFATTSRDEP